MPEYIEKYYTLKDLWKSVKKLPSDRKYLAGGTDLVISLSCGNDKSSVWLDISDIDRLKEIKEDGKNIFIGAAVKISELESNPLIKKWASALSECVKYYASPSIRNTATLGGNYANASPCADGVLALAALRAKVMLNLYDKRRVVDILSIVKGPKKIDLKKDELIEGFIVSKEERKSIFMKMMHRKRFGIAKAGLCMCYKLEKGKLRDVSISLSSVAPSVVRAKKTEEYLEGKNPSKAQTKACQLIREEISPLTDIRSTSDYRMRIVSVFLSRALCSI